MAFYQKNTLFIGTEEKSVTPFKVSRDRLTFLLGANKSMLIYFGNP